MKIKINGQDKEFNASQSLEAVITDLLPDSTRVIAELNGNIVKKDAWNSTDIKDGDIIELVSFVGGG